jgi:hypothetical protein
MRTSLLIALAAGAALAASGCYGGDDDHYYQDGPPDGGGAYCAPGSDQSSIDTGSTLDLDPGTGAGVTAEYLGSGAWRFATACDTARSGYPCAWDLLVTPLDGSVLDFAPESLERNDQLERAPGPDGSGDQSVRLVATNDYDLDAFTLDATPGIALEIDVILDDQCGGTFLHWLRDGQVVHASTQVADLTPSEP